MGMSLNQGLLALTYRSHAIGFKLQTLSMQKQSMTREMQKAMQNYRDSFSAKSLKWTANNGVTYSDLSYKTLMNDPNISDHTPRLITNSDGNVVLSSEFSKYAKTLQEAGGEYEGENRYNILAELTGVSVDTLKLSDSTSEAVTAKKAEKDDAESARNDLLPRSLTKDQIKTELLNNLGYKSSDTVTKDNVDGLASALKASLIGKNYFPSDTEKQIKQILDGDGTDNFKGKVRDIKDDAANGTKKYTGKNAMTVESFVDSFVAGIFNNVFGITTEQEDDTIPVSMDRKGNGNYSEYDAAEKALAAAKNAYSSAVSDHGQVLDGSVETKIEYYDRLFQAISDMGWVEDENVGDANYLDQMFQNGSYYLTQMNAIKDYDDNLESYISGYDYDTEAAESDPNIVKVNDSDTQNEALAEYEYQKSLISSKEAMIDTRMKNLETEQNAIKKMIESDKNIVNENIDRTFNLWS